MVLGIRCVGTTGYFTFVMLNRSLVFRLTGASTPNDKEASKLPHASERDHEFLRATKSRSCFISRSVACQKEKGTTFLRQIRLSEREQGGSGIQARA